MSYIQDVLGGRGKRNAGELEFLQAVREVMDSLEPVCAAAQEVSGSPHSGTHGRTG
jgi:hypothetical protein